MLRRVGLLLALSACSGSVAEPVPSEDGGSLEPAPEASSAPYGCTPTPQPPGCASASYFYRCPSADEASAAVFAFEDLLCANIDAVLCCDGPLP